VHLPGSIPLAEATNVLGFCKSLWRILSFSSETNKIMSTEKIAYRNIPAEDSHVDDDQLANSLRARIDSSRTRRYLWCLFQTALLLTIAVQSIVIVFLSQVEKDACRSIRK
jgi:hypothetical protein